MELDAKPSRWPQWWITLWASSAAFSAYFCMYAFRKPFAAASFSGLHFAGTDFGLKSALVISQVIGYAISKFIGIKVCSEISASKRALALVGLIAVAELALVLFGAVAPSFRVVAIFLNGLPLGMVWGMVVAYLEGRRTSEFLLATLSCSFIVSSGVVKDVGRWTMSSWNVGEAWMPCVTGLLFLPAFLLSVAFLAALPALDPSDVKARTQRRPMPRWTHRICETIRAGAGTAAGLLSCADGVSRLSRQLRDRSVQGDGVRQRAGHLQQDRDAGRIRGSGDAGGVEA